MNFQPYFGTANQGTRLVTYSTTQDRDVSGLTTITHFTAMQNFNAKSTEEWRYEDYKVDRATKPSKFGQPVSSAEGRKLFGQSGSFTEVRRGEGLFGQGFFLLKVVYFQILALKAKSQFTKKKKLKLIAKKKPGVLPKKNNLYSTLNAKTHFSIAIQVTQDSANHSLKMLKNQN